MAQRRVAPSGFGGPTGGLQLLRGAAEGAVARQQRQQEARRQAIQNRLSKAQMERMKQQMRFQREEQQRLQAERQEEKQATEGAVANLKQYYMSQGLDAEEAENRAVAEVEDLPTVADIERRKANMEQLRSSTEVNRTSGDIKEEELQNLRVSRNVRRILSIPPVLNVIKDPDISTATKVSIVKSQAPSLNPDIDTELLDEAAGKAVELAERNQNRFLGDQDRQTIQRAQEVLDHFNDDVDAAVQQVQQAIQENPDRAEEGRAVIEWLESQRDDDFAFGGSRSPEEIRAGVEAEGEE